MTRSFLTLAIVHFACTAFSQVASYTVDFNNHAQKRALVKATFSGFPSQNLSMFVHPSQGVPQGEAGFIQNLTATNALGQALVIKYDDMGEWKVTGKKTESFTVSYEVRLEHDAYAWFEAGGVDEVGYSTPDGFFSTGYSLFLFPAIEDLSAVKDVTVKFDLPANWKASTPWTLTETNTFEVMPDIRFLLNNCMFVGSHHEEVITLDGFELRMAYGSDIYESRELFIDLMKKTLGEVKGIFGESRANQYLIVINRHKMTDGSAFRSSFSEIIKGEVSETSRVTWGHTMLHETVHLWNGLTLIPTGQEEWFKEGFTDYLTMELESRTGINTPEIVMKRMERMYSRYIIGKFIQRAPESLQESGNRKQEIRSLVYGGGALFALALDIELREATNNAVGVDDLMRSLFTEFALKGKTYTSQDILKMTSQLSGKNFDEFFQTFLYNNGYTDYSGYFERIGINAYPFAEEIYLSPNQTATEQQKAIRKSIFGW